MWKEATKPFSVEYVVSLGSFICELPEINDKIIEPHVLFKASVVLGESLPCNVTCLSKLIEIVVQEGAFGDPKFWTFGDVHDLGVIITGLFNVFLNKYILNNNIF